MTTALLVALTEHDVDRLLHISTGVLMNGGVSWFCFVGSGSIIRDGLTLPPLTFSMLVNASWMAYEEPMRTTPQTTALLKLVSITMVTFICKEACRRCC